MKKWFAIRVTYNREMKVKRELDSIHIENFLPMKSKIIFRGEKKIKELVPAIHNLIFLHTTKEQLKEYKATTTLPIRYIMNRETREPITIPDYQMSNFIAVAGNAAEQIVYLDPNLSNFKKGDKVRVIGGVFEGAEGYFMRIKGDRRVVVCINGIAAVATAFIHPSLVTKIDD